MKLLFVLPEYPPSYGGGIGSFYGALLPALVAQGHQVDVFLGSAFVHGRDGYRLDGVNITVLQTERLERFLEVFEHYRMLPELRRYLAAAWALFEQAKDYGPYDVVEVVDWGMMFVPWVLDGLQPTIVHMHGSSGQIDFRDPSPSGALQGHLLRMLEAATLRDATALHTHSIANQKEWASITEQKVMNLPPPLIVGESPRNRRSGGEGLVVGRIQKWKGPTVLCEALQILGSQAPEVTWAGRDTRFGEKGSSMDEHLTRTYPGVWREKVKPIGEVVPSQVSRMQAEAGFVIVPSLWDVYNLTAVEAMGAGAVVVCSTGAGAVDLIEHGVNGFAFPADDPRALADTIRAVMALTAGERDAISAAARDTVTRQLAPEVIAKRKVRAYEKAMDAFVGRDVDEWVRAAVSPATSGDGGLAFLDHQPLRDLLGYTGSRIVAKLGITKR